MLVGVVTIAGGCARGVDGLARPAQTAVTVLLSEDEMTSAVGNRSSSFGFQPFVGGLAIMPDGLCTDGDADDANRTVDRFVRQWQGCDGQTVLKHLRGAANSNVIAAVSDVAAAGSTLTATVTTRQGPGAAASRYQRALAVRGDTIVEVSLAVSDAGGRASSREDQSGSPGDV